MINKIKEKKKQNILILTVVLLISLHPFASFFNTITDIFFGKGFIYDAMLLYAGLLVMLIWSIFLILHRIKKDVVLIIYIILFISIFTLIFKPQNFQASFTSWDDIYGNAFYYFLFTILGYTIMRHIYDYELFLSVLTKASIFIIIISILNYILLFNETISGLYMAVSYDALIFVACLLVIYFERKNLFIGLFGLIGTIFIFIVGARGALVSLILAMMIYFIFKKYSITQKVIFTLLLAIPIFLFSQYFEVIMLFLDTKLSIISLQSRTINLFLDNSFLDDSGRGEIQKVLLNNLSTFGSGLFGDRFYGGGAYAHNILIEILFQWGLLVGPLLIMTILILISHSLFTRRNEFYLMVIIFLSSGFFKLMFSGSYLVEVNFAVLMALCVNSMQRIRTIENK